MAKTQTIYICQQCGSESPKWQGQCHSCGAWNSLVESVKTKKSNPGKTSLVDRAEVVKLDQVTTEIGRRIHSGFEELDRVLGGGLMPGSVTLLGGEPGVGKSTLLLQLALNIGGMYVTAEESAHQVKQRADRLGSGKLSQLSLLSTSDIDQALAAIDQHKPECVIIDSIQTVSTGDLDGVPGSVGQVRECANRLVRSAKQSNIPVIIVSHVTKEGTIAGPKVLEHVVDTVLYVEGDPLSTTRLVRGVKNRFGPVHEVGLFNLEEEGMREITDPTGLLASSQTPTSGSAITVSMEGIRPVLLEVQALTAPTSFGLPRRTANGMDYNRLLMLIAVLTKRAKISLGNQDIYTNLAGGLQIKETALDLAICLALVSSSKDRPLPNNTVIFGEVSLSGEVKSVSGQQKRLEQAKKLGYKQAICSDNAKTLSQAISLAFSKT